MTYLVKEILPTLQGEGAQTGRAAILCRFSGCNLWSGREAQRASATCRFCDTDFVGTDGPGGGHFGSTDELADRIDEIWSDAVGGAAGGFVVCTGGEPLLQLDEALIGALHARAFEVAVETNGTIEAPDGIDWVCVSPKSGAELVLRQGDELKLVWPQDGIDPAALEHLDFDHFFLQPMDGPDRDRNTELASEYCRHHPPWKLSLQTHKLLGIP